MVLVAYKKNGAFKRLFVDKFGITGSWPSQYPITCVAYGRWVLNGYFF